MTKINTKGLSFLQPVGRGLKRGFGCGVEVSDGGGDVVLVPADALVYDCVLEGVLIVVEACGAGFHFNEDDFLDVLRVHAFEDEEVDRRSDEFGLGGAEREIGKIRGELFGEHAAKHRA